MAGEQFRELREKFKFFDYKNYEKSIEDGYLVCKFFFEIEGLESFVSKWKFPITELCPFSEEELLKDEILDQMIFNLGMVETISYYKITCPKTAKISCGSLNEWQQKWWQKLYRNGLGEFLYINGIEYIEPEELVKFEVKEEALKTYHDNRKYEGALVPIGGGKDSVVSLEV